MSLGPSALYQALIGSMSLVNSPDVLSRVTLYHESHPDRSMRFVSSLVNPPEILNTSLGLFRSDPRCV
jgi:hypothetical protein